MNDIDPAQLVNGLLWYVVFLFSTTLHEASHALVAMRLGDRTAYDGGQVTLNPIPHMRREPFGMLIVPVISFLLGGWMIGWASIPYDRSWAYRYPKASAVMAAAGPASNLFLALIAALAIRLGIWGGILAAPDSVSFKHVVDAAQDGGVQALASFISVFFSLNLLLFFFNLLPTPPLDGSKIIPLFLGRRQAQRYLDWVHEGWAAFIGIFVAWNFFDYLYSPVHLWCVNLLFWGQAHYG